MFKLTFTFFEVFEIFNDHRFSPPIIELLKTISSSFYVYDYIRAALSLSFILLSSFSEKVGTYSPGLLDTSWQKTKFVITS